MFHRWRGVGTLASPLFRNKLAALALRNGHRRHRISCIGRYHLQAYDRLRNDFWGVSPIRGISLQRKRLQLTRKRIRYSLLVLNRIQDGPYSICVSFFLQ